MDLNKKKENDLKKDSRLLIKWSPSLGSINQVISIGCQQWLFGERSLLPSVGACRLYVGKPSVILRRLIWVVIRETFEMLNWSNQKGWSRKASNIQKRASHGTSSGILSSSLKQALIDDEASQPQHDSALNHKRFSIHMDEQWILYWWLVFTKLLNWTSHCYWRNKLESMWLSSTPTLQRYHCNVYDHFSPY